MSEKIIRKSKCRQRRLRVQRVVRERIVRKCAEQIPTTWLDDLLTGPNAVLKGNGGTWGCPEIEALLKAIKSRILALSNAGDERPT